MSGDCSNYRTAKGGEVTCNKCKYVTYVWFKKRPVCDGFYKGQSVGNSKTCDEAKK